MLRSLPYAIEFDWQNGREYKKLVTVYYHEREAGNFVVRKGLGDRKIHRHGPIILEMDHFPTYDELADEVQEEYGGGTYNIYAGS